MIQRTESANLSSASYPLYMMSLSNALKIKKLEPHQVCLQRGDLVKYEDIQPADKYLIFVSHQWADHLHPDPTNAQFGVFQAVFGSQGLAAGSPRFVDMEVTDMVTYGLSNNRVKHKAWQTLLRDPDKVFVWYDFYSVPQTSFDPDCRADQLLALNSIHKVGSCLVLECRQPEPIRSFDAVVKRAKLRLNVYLLSCVRVCVCVLFRYCSTSRCATCLSSWHLLWCPTRLDRKKLRHA